MWSWWSVVRLADEYRSSLSLDLGLVMPLNNLRGEVLQRKSRREGGPHGVEVRAEGVGLERVSVRRTRSCQSPSRQLTMANSFGGGRRGVKRGLSSG